MSFISTSHKFPPKHNINRDSVLMNPQNFSQKNIYISSSNIHKPKRLLMLHLKSQNEIDKELLRGRLFKKVNTSLVMSKEKVAQLKRDFSTKKESLILTKTKENFQNITNNWPNLVCKEKSSSRFEDMYITPHELISSNFSSREKKFILTHPKYFKLGQGSLRDPKLFINTNLKDIINKEEAESQQQMLINKKSSLSFYKKNNKEKKIDSKNFEEGEIGLKSNDSKSTMLGNITPIREKKINNYTHIHNHKQNVTSLLHKKSRNVIYALPTISLKQVQSFVERKRKKSFYRQKLFNTQREVILKKDFIKVTNNKKLFEKLKQERKILTEKKIQKEQKFIHNILKQLEDNYKCKNAK